MIIFKTVVPVFGLSLWVFGNADYYFIIMHSIGVSVIYMVYVLLKNFTRDFIMFLFLVTGRAVAILILEMEDDEQLEVDLAI